jgi:hypothetical protein
MLELCRWGIPVGLGEIKKRVERSTLFQEKLTVFD